MNKASRLPFLAVLVATVALMCPWASAEELPPRCKNHFILRCDVVPELEWVPVPGSRMSHPSSTATLLADGRVLLAGGDLPASGDQVYDPRLDMWVPVPPAQPSGTGSEIYDPVTGTWRLLGRMNVRRMNHRAVRLHDGRVLVVGGDLTPGANSTAYNGPIPATAEVFDPRTESWTLTPSLNFFRQSGWPDVTATVLRDGTVLVTGGVDVHEAALASAEIYDPALGVWRVTGSMANGRIGHTATLLPDGKVLVIGGVWDWQFGFYVRSGEIYDPATSTWHYSDSAPMRVNHTATILTDGRILVVGGQRSASTTGENFPPEANAIWGFSTTDTAWVYDPSRGETTAMPPLLYKRHSHFTIPLPNGDLLAIGGVWWAMPIVYQFTWGPVLQSERFHAATGTWIGVVESGVPPNQPTSATLLADGRVFVMSDAGASLLRYSPRVPFVLRTRGAN